MDLPALRTMTKQLLGQRTITTSDDTTWYSDRVNAAYRRLTTFQGHVTTPALKQPALRILRFMELERQDDRTITTTGNPFVAPVASGVYMILDVYDRTNNRWLSRIPIKYYRRLDPDETGTPVRWTPGGQGGVVYFVHPIPSAVSEEIAVRETTYTYPTALTGTGSPIIPEVWHPAIAYAAASEGALLLDWRDRHAEMEQRFLSYIAERKSPHEEADYSGGRRYFHVGTWS